MNAGYGYKRISFFSIFKKNNIYHRKFCNIASLTKSNFDDDRKKQSSSCNT